MTKEELTAKHNYERAIEAIRDLEEHTKKCSLETPQLSGVSVKFIEKALHTEEIGERDYNTLLDRVATANSKFFHNCGCNILPLVNVL